MDAWLPIAFRLPDGVHVGRPLFAGADWQIVETRDDGGRALLAKPTLWERWVDSGLLRRDQLTSVQFGAASFLTVSSLPSQALGPVAELAAPANKVDAVAFASAMSATREVDPVSPLQDAIYIEKLSRLLPTYSISARTDDALVLGFWLSGGVQVSTHAFRRLHQLVGWLDEVSLAEIIATAGLAPHLAHEHSEADVRRPIAALPPPATDGRERLFELPGRPELAAFFNEHVIDILRHQERYKALGIDFPGAIILHGPPGCGKTFAVEKLVEYLNWPSYQIDASSVASPYIHETSRKVANIFASAIESAPSVLVIDEMEAFLADREAGVGQHRVEEVAEFLRRIPEAVKNEVLIIAMTNRIDMIDSAVMRRGRFDHVLKVDYAGEDEIRGLLEALFRNLPVANNVSAGALATDLAGRPLSDVTFIVREGARLAARAGRDVLDSDSLRAALAAAPPRGPDAKEQRRIGFV